MKQIESLLRQHIGLDAASIGSSVIGRTVRWRMKSLGQKTLDGYKRLLQTSRAEWDALVEAVVVSETWFFRDKEPFRVLTRQVQENWMRTPRAGLLRVLSVPCSSGEEPYSVAMALLDAGLTKERFLIDAADISTRALICAQRAIYGKNSFRGKDLGFRSRYFQQTKEGYVLQPEVRVCVRFFHDNLLNEGFLAGQTEYDFIFCRNLLIYFDRETQLKALEKLHRMLSPAGLLFVGPAETQLVLESGFASLKIPMAFACRKISAKIAGSAHQSPTIAPAATLPPFVRAEQPVASTANCQPSGSCIDSTTVSIPDLKDARRLADAGQLKEAAEICEAHLRACGPTAQAYYLLGLVRDAEGDPLAVEFYRKALYLEPNHHETLLQMALLSQKAGNPAQARTFKRRAERAQPKI